MVKQCTFELTVSIIFGHQEKRILGPITRITSQKGAFIVFAKPPPRSVPKPKSMKVITHKRAHIGVSPHEGNAFCRSVLVFWALSPS